MSYTGPMKSDRILDEIDACLGSSEVLSSAELFARSVERLLVFLPGPTSTTATDCWGCSELTYANEFDAIGLCPSCHHEICGGEAPAEDPDRVQRSFTRPASWLAMRPFLVSLDTADIDDVSQETAM